VVLVSRSIEVDAAQVPALEMIVGSTRTDEVLGAPVIESPS
jgi:hypothetical protein